QARPGAAFTAARHTLTRSVTRTPTPRVWAEDPVTGKRRNLSREEDRAFWTWAIIEVLRATGVRVEELLELSHHSLVHSQLPRTPATGRRPAPTPPHPPQPPNGPCPAPRSPPTSVPPPPPASRRRPGRPPSSPPTTATSASGCRPPRCYFSAAPAPRPAESAT